MHQEAKDKLIGALRSGVYKEGSWYLRHFTGYSALGILCDISDKGEWRKDRNCYNYVVKGRGQEGFNRLAPIPVFRDFAGMSEEGMQRLGRMFDRKGTFLMIAGMIEAEWKTL